MSEEFIKSLKYKKIEPGDSSILQALEKFDCGNPEHFAYGVSKRMLCRLKEHISGEKIVDDVYYVIWDKVDIFLFFSLQASLVFSNAIIFPEDVNKLETVYNWSVVDKGCTFYFDSDIFKEQLCYYDGLQEKYSADEEKFPRVICAMESIRKGKTYDVQNNLYVGQSFPTIEMVNFCKNHAVKEKWESAGIKTPIGATLFWYKVMPIIKEVSQKIGCVYVSLFAADASLDGTDRKQILLSYYENALKFKQDSNLRTLKPKYDWECIFLCQKVSELCREEEDFKKNFLSGFSDDDV